MSYQPNKESLDARPLPSWFADAKLGIFIHWGLYSIPAFAEGPDGDFAGFMAELSAGEDTKGAVPYAEWYLNALRTPGSATARHHAATYGVDFSYYDFRTQFEANANQVDFGEWADFFQTVGADYVVLVARHLDGYPLWPSAVRNPNMPPDFHPPRDLVGALTTAVRERGMKMGLYYAAGIDWTFTDRPLGTMTDLMEQSALGAEYAKYAEAQWLELIDRYQPAVLWNDMGMPAELDPHELFTQYYATVPDGVVNDRWEQVRLPDGNLERDVYLGVLGFALRLMHKIGKAVPTRPPRIHHDFRTYEYQLPTAATNGAGESDTGAGELAPGPWELTRGLGESFGYDSAETAADELSGPELVRLFANVVGRGGNLLINVGPDGAGRIPAVQQRPLAELGAWLRTNRDAIHEAVPLPEAAQSTGDGIPVRFTQRNNDIHAIVLADELAGTITFDNVTPPAGSRARVLGSDAPVTWRTRGTGVEVELPRLTGSPAYVVAFPAP